MDSGTEHPSEYWEAGDRLPRQRPMKFRPPSSPELGAKMKPPSSPELMAFLEKQVPFEPWPPSEN